MSYLTEKELVNLGDRGIISGPHEGPESFFSRARDPISSHLSHATIEFFFSISPDWVEITYSNQGLLPWQGGCTVIDSKKVSLQIRKGRGKIFGIYSREEILAHELVHAARMAFDEPIYEEILAYRTSTSRFRRFYGPLFRTSNESLFFMATLFVLVVVNLFYMIPFLMILLGGGHLSYFLLRLHANQKKFSATLSRLKSLLGSEKKALSLLLYLTDQEITTFSQMKVEEIVAYSKKQHSIRWQQIILKFLAENDTQTT